MRSGSDPNAAGNAAEMEGYMSIWRTMRLMRSADRLLEKQKQPQKDAFDRMCLQEYAALCNMGSPEQLRMLQKEQLKGYHKWRAKHLDASPLDFFNK